MIKVNPCLFVANNVICVVYVDDCIFWEHSQSKIGKFVESFKEGGTSYYLGFSKGQPFSEFLGIDTKTSDDGGFQFYQPVLIQKVF